MKHKIKICAIMIVCILAVSTHSVNAIELTKTKSTTIGTTAGSARATVTAKFYTSGANRWKIGSPTIAVLSGRYGGSSHSIKYAQNSTTQYAYVTINCSFSDYNYNTYRGSSKITFTGSDTGTLY